MGILDVGIPKEIAPSERLNKRHLNGLILSLFLGAGFAIFAYLRIDDGYKAIIPQSIFLIGYMLFYICNYKGLYDVSKKLIAGYFLVHITIMCFVSTMSTGNLFILFIITPFIAFMTNRKIIIYSTIAISIIIIINLIWILFPNIRDSIIIWGIGNINKKLEVSDKVTYYGKIGTDITVIIIISFLLNSISRSISLYKEETRKATSELQQAKEAIEQKEKQKTEAFINISHEIKTPATIVSNYLEQHIKEHGSTKELLIAEQNINKLKRDMLNVLDFEKLDKGMAFYDHSKIADISNIVRMNIQMFYEIAGRKGIKLKDDIEENIYIMADPTAIDRVINNLIENAIKYTESNGQIDISLKADKKNIEFIISDTGIGISEESKKNIFKPYFQVSEKKSNLQGIGMGLNIVKNIIESINGEIIVESNLNMGTTFKILLKRYYLKEDDRVKFLEYDKQKITDSVNPTELKAENFQGEKSNIFIVEDNIQMLSYLQENLMDSYNVYYAVNGKEALEKVKNILSPNIIISDIMMDEMDGFEFYEELLKIDKYKSIPFIFLTAKTGEHEKIKGLKKGAVDFISKPFNIEELHAKIESLINIREALKEETLFGIGYKIYKYLGKIDKSENKSEIEENKDILSELYSKYKVSKRQTEIISLIKQGKENKEIAEILGIKVNTVKVHVSRMFEKCRVQNRIELINVFKEA